MSRRSRSALSAALSLCVASAAFGQTPAGNSFVIRAKAVYPVTARQFGPIERGMLIVRDGRIVEVGADLEIPPDLPLIELRDETIVPGFVNAASSWGGAHDGNESLGAGYDALDAFDPYADNRPAVSRGTTTIHIDPGGHRLVTGQGAVVKIAGPPDKRVVQPASDLTVNFGVYNPPPSWKLSFYASSDEPIMPAIRQGPASRLGQYRVLEDAIAAVAGAGSTAPQFDMHAQRFAAVWKSNAPLRVQVRRAADIDGAAQFLKRHSRRGYLVGLTEGDKLREALLAAGVPVVFRVEQAYNSPADNLGNSPDALASRLRASGSLKAAKVALAGQEGEGYEDLRIIAALAVRGGMSQRQAVEGITRVAAEIIGVDSRVGSLAPGKDADFLVMTGPPLGIDSSVQRVFVDGRTVFEAPAGGSLVVKAGTIWLGNGSTIHDASILVENGKIKAVGSRVPHPLFAKVIDAGRDGFISPGFIDAHGHLGLESDRQVAGPDLSIADTVGVAGRDFLRVAQGGVTTVMLAAYNTAANGSRVAAVKTFGADRGDMLVRAVSAMKFSVRGKDPLQSVEDLRKVLKSGKDYDDKWKKYDEDLKKWEAEKAKGATAEKKPESETAAEKDKPDPITGTWSFTMSGALLPEETTGTMTLKLTGDVIEGRITIPGEPDDAVVKGRLDGVHITAEIDEDTPFGKPKITATLDRDDHMTGNVTVGEFSIKFDASRTDKSAVEFKVSHKRKKGKGGRPLPPKVDENLEPLRQLLAQKLPALVDVESAAHIALLLKLFVEEFKAPLVFLNAEEAEVHAEALAREKVGVVVPSTIVREKDRKPYVQSVELSRKGVSVALQSDSEDGARNLGLMGLFAVQQGLGGDQALSALTIDAARMFKIDDRVGSLEKGKDADFLIFTGHPFDAETRLDRVIISGKEVPDAE